jgi:hypothetical protein
MTAVRDCINPGGETGIIYLTPRAAKQHYVKDRPVFVALRLLLVIMAMGSMALLWPCFASGSIGAASTQRADVNLDLIGWNWTFVLPKCHGRAMQGQIGLLLRIIGIPLKHEVIDRRVDSIVETDAVLRYETYRWRKEKCPDIGINEVTFLDENFPRVSVRFITHQYASECTLERTPKFLETINVFLPFKLPGRIAGGHRVHVESEYLDIACWGATEILPSHHDGEMRAVVLPFQRTRDIDNDIDPRSFCISSLGFQSAQLTAGNSRIDPSTYGSNDRCDGYHFLYGCLFVLLGVALTFQIFWKPDFYGNWFISIALIPVAFCAGAYGTSQIIDCLGQRFYVADQFEKSVKQFGSSMLWPCVTYG